MALAYKQTTFKSLDVVNYELKWGNDGTKVPEEGLELTVRPNIKPFPPLASV
jgi:hypothetical protein